MSAGGSANLQFLPLQSCPDVSFWSVLGDKKLDEYRLDEESVAITGFLSASRHRELPSSLQVDRESFTPCGSAPLRAGWHPAPGELRNFNTLASFKGCGKAALLAAAAARVWDDICSGEAERRPNNLARFLVVSYADLKTFHFHYWFAFPALKPPAPFSALPARLLAEALPPAQAAAILAACDDWRALGSGAATSGDAGNEEASSSGSGGTGAAASTAGADGAAASGKGIDFAWLVRASRDGSGATAHPLSDWHDFSAGSSAGHEADSIAMPGDGGGGDGGMGAYDAFLAFSDPCNLDSNPGWPLRNLLLLAAARWHVTEIKVLCIRDTRGRADASRSLLLDVHLPAVSPDWCAAAPPGAVGWEANADGQLAARTVDLGPIMSPNALAEQAVDLNLRLMRWRAAPDLDVKRMADARCLILGAGTLGCVVARTLLAWGARAITFVDSAAVAYSNPVRQSLFLHEDCASGGAPKAAAAAAMLRRIFPSARAEGVRMSIPMPGHPPGNAAQEEKLRQDAERLHDLVASHDVVFLLTDTRESRWLPSLLAAALNRVAITSAIGFDSFLVMRHGLGPRDPRLLDDSTSGSGGASGAGSNSNGAGGGSGAGGDSIGAGGGSSGAGGNSSGGGSKSGGGSEELAAARGCGPRLGCYFCNDVVAPLNSTVDRTLEQQCTVARPGLAHIAGALSVELLAALLQHPAGPEAPAAGATGAGAATTGSHSNSDLNSNAALGAVPHMVRGQLASWQQVVMNGQAFSSCTACSAAVVDLYQQKGWEFLRRAISEPAYLEDVTGLAALRAQADLLLGCSSGSSSGSDDEGAATGDAGAGDGAAAASQSGSTEDDDWTEL